MEGEIKGAGGGGTRDVKVVEGRDEGEVFKTN